MTWPLVDFASSPGFQQIFDYAGQTDGQPKYAGWATPGVSTSADKWKIRRFTYDANRQIINIQYANSDVAFRFVWDLRTSYTYG